MTIADALNVYDAKRAVYEVDCIPTPAAKARECWARRDVLADCLTRIQAADAAVAIGDAKPQIEAMQAPCSALRAAS